MKSMEIGIKEETVKANHTAGICSRKKYTARIYSCEKNLPYKTSFCLSPN